MKKLIVMLMLTVFSIGAYAQTQQGQSSFGFNIGYGFDSKNATLGVDYRYCITDAVRLSPSITHFVKNDGLSAWAIDMNAHYVVKLNEMFGFYPLAGLSLSFWKYSYGLNWGGYDLKGSGNETRFGANIGLGGEVYATGNLTVGLEVKYNIIKDMDQALLGVRVGYSF
ncbi:MAG: porin family protein [Parabacteroides sp.]|nr:porin family protein [Parabacteroides sp.]